MTVVEAFVGFLGAMLLTLVLLILGKSLEYKPSKRSSEKTKSYLGGEKGFNEPVQVFVKNFQYIITFVAFEMAVLVLSFALQPLNINEIGFVIYLGILIAALLVIAT